MTWETEDDQVRSIALTRNQPKEFNGVDSNRHGRHLTTGGSCRKYSDKAFSGASPDVVTKERE